MTTTLQHRGYDGSVEYSAEDKMLHGRVLGIRDMISFGGKSVREIEKNFCDAVDEYLSFCERRGRRQIHPLRAASMFVSPPIYIRRRRNMLNNTTSS